jgi:putative flippase GtrA
MKENFATLWGRWWRYVVTGVASNVTLYLVFLGLLWLRVPYQIALTISYVLGMIWGYVVNRLWSWRDKSPVLTSAATYVAVYLGVYICHLGFVSGLVEFAGLKPSIATLISFVFLTIPLFFLLNRLVYQNPKSRC